MLGNPQNSSALTIARLFKKAQWEVEQEAAKPNMMKKFGGKFKKAFLKKKQSLTQKSEDTYVPDVHSKKQAQLDSLAKEHERSSTVDKRDLASTHVGVDEGVLVPGKTAQQPALTASPKAAFDTADDYPLRRSSSVPASPSSPTTGASSDTLCNTPTHSDTSSSPFLAKYRQALDEHRQSSGKCQQALAEHIKAEEKENENIEWAALVEWVNIAHQSELDFLGKCHAAKVGQLQKERSEARRSLELRNRELRAMKREIKKLKESIEETTKDQGEKQPALSLHPADESDAKSVDQDEGGVLLTQDTAMPSENVDDKEGKTCDTLREAGEAARGMGLAKDGKKEATMSKKEKAEERNKAQQALKQQLMEDSTPEPLLEVEAGPSMATRKVAAIRSHNRAPFMDVRDLQDHNDALQAEAEAMEEEITVLKAQNHFAQLEVGHCHAANACYRAAAEDDNPARTAHLDGLLKRKDEAYANLEERAAECAELLEEEKKQRAIEKEYSAAEIRGMHKELAHRFKVIDALTEGRDILKAQNDWVFQMFQRKILHSDVIEAFLRDYYVIQKDNALLIKMINERQCYMDDTEKQLADLKAEKIANDHAAHADYLEHRRTQQSLNGLTYVNSQLNAKIDFQDEMREELKVELEGQIKQQAADIQQILLSGADNWLIQRQQAQERQIDHLNAKIAEVSGIANQWRTRSLEQDDGFCPMNNFSEVADFHAEETRWRLKEAERQVVHLQQVVREMDRERKGKGKEREQQVAGEMSRDRKGKGKEREVLETNRDRKGKGKEKEVLVIGHDGSKWLQDRAEAERVREHFRWME